MGAIRPRNAALLVAASALCIALASLGSVDSVPYALFCAAFYPPLILNAVIDGRTQLLVRRWTHIAGVVALAHMFYPLVLQLFESRTTPSPNAIYEGLTRCCGLSLMINSCVLGVFTLLYLFTGGRAMGAGDLRLLWVLGIWHTPQSVQAFILAITFAVVGQGVFASVLWVRKRVGRKSRLPFGPALVIASIIVTFALPIIS